jgi:hypothetical protein
LASGLQAATIARLRLGFPTAPPDGFASPQPATRWLIMQEVRGHPEGLPLFVGTRFQILFHSPLGVLFTFPSRYSFTIGQQVVLSLGGWSPQIPPGLHVARGTQEFHSALFHFRVRGCHPVSPTFPGSSASFQATFAWLLQPRTRNLVRFGLFRFRSPLLTESHLISFPPGTEMFQFPGLAPRRVPPYEQRWVSPFGNPRIIACLPAPRGLSQAPASFIASCCQGIHHVPFVAINHRNLSTSRTRTPKRVGPRNRRLNQRSIEQSEPEGSDFDTATTTIPMRNVKDQGTVVPAASEELGRRVEANGLEPSTPCLQSRCSPS